MEQNIILIKDYCNHYNIDISFIEELKIHDLLDVNLSQIESNEYIIDDDLLQLEKFRSMFYDMGVNMEGLEIINYLQNKLINMQDELKMLKEELKIFRYKE